MKLDPWHGLELGPCGVLELFLRVREWDRAGVERRGWNGGTLGFVESGWRSTWYDVLVGAMRTQARKRPDWIGLRQVPYLAYRYSDFRGRRSEGRVSIARRTDRMWKKCDEV